MMVFATNLQLKPAEPLTSALQSRTDATILTAAHVATNPADNNKRTTKRGLDYALPSFVDDSAYTIAKLASADPWLGA